MSTEKNNTEFMTGNADTAIAGIKEVQDVERLDELVKIEKEAENPRKTVFAAIEKQRDALAEAAKKADEEQAAADAESKKEAGIYTDNRGLKFRFKDNAPKTINIYGRSMTQQEILDADDVASELVYGNSNYLTQIH